MDLKCGVKEADEAYENHKACGKEIHDKFKGILQKKRADQRLDAVYQKKKGKKSNRDVFSPPEA